MTILRKSVSLACFAILGFSGSQVLAAETVKDFQGSQEGSANKNFLSLFQDLESSSEITLSPSEIPESTTPVVISNSAIDETTTETITSYPDITETTTEVVINEEQEIPQPLSEVSENTPSTNATDLNLLAVQPQWRIAEDVALESGDAIAQSWEDNPRRAADRNNRRLSNHFSYFAVGGNIGITGSASGLGKGGGGTLGKTSFSENLSLHTGGLLIGEGASVAALTYDFPLRVDTGGIVASPFIGAGVIYADLFNNDFSFGPLFMTGIDVPVSYSFILTSRVNVGYIRENTEVGVMLGFGYIFTRSIWDVLGIF